jgi:hypothetical protein
LSDVLKQSITLFHDKEFLMTKTVPMFVFLLCFFAMFYGETNAQVNSPPPENIEYSGPDNEYPAFYAGDTYGLNDPNATGIAVIVRDVYHSHPSIIFSDPVDFLFSIDFEEQSFRDFFPLGVKAGYLDENSGVWSWYLFEPLQDRFQFDSQATLDLLAFAHPIST